MTEKNVSNLAWAWRTKMAAERCQSIVWSDDFLIGIEELDYEHRRLVEDIDTLHRELVTDVEMDRIEGTLGHIHARMQAHFALEERFMLLHEYPHYPEHKAEHEQLLDEYTELMTKLKREWKLDDREAIQDVLSKWIVNHILSSDKKMSLMVKSAKGT